VPAAAAPIGREAMEKTAESRPALTRSAAVAAATAACPSLADASLQAEIHRLRMLFDTCKHCHSA